MISFDNFRLSDKQPIYIQIILYVKRGIVGGIITNGDEMPSRRYISAILGVNPNTVQKALHMLEEEGLIQSRAGAKSFITLSAEKAAEVRLELLRTEAQALVEALKQSGASLNEAKALITKLWEEEP